MPTSSSEGEITNTPVAAYRKVTERTIYRLDVARNPGLQGWRDLAVLAGRYLQLDQKQSMEALAPIREDNIF
jgi:hypothetical protein